MTRKTRARTGRASWRKHALLAAALLLVALGFYAGFRAAQPPPPPDFESLRQVDGDPDLPPPAEPKSADEPLAEKPEATGETSAEPSPEAEELELRRQPPPARRAGGPRIALVIDDLGRSLEDLDTLKALGIPITYAVLPFEVRTPEVVSVLSRRGEEMLCHLPMEAQGGNNPGPGALLASMSSEELKAATEAALDAVPGAVGLNNHMGSAVVADVPAMEAVLDVLDRRGLYFLDSRTTAETVGYSLARRRGIPTAERQVFLDTRRDPAFIQQQFQVLLAAARERGGAVAIAHPYPETLDILTAQVPVALGQGFEFVTVGNLVDR